MSDTPSPVPEFSKPKLSLTPKAPVEQSAPAPAVATESKSLPPRPSPGVQNDSGARPPALVSSGNKPSFKLQGEVHPANVTDAPVFTSPMPVAKPEGPSGAIVALSAVAAAAALTFAALLYLKTQ